MVMTQSQAEILERDDPLGTRRERFRIPTWTNPVTGQIADMAYLLGNSLGCQPVGAAGHVGEVLEDWAASGVEAHTRGPRPWIGYDGSLRAAMARLAGCDAAETGLMNGLTVNLHLMLASFYQPTTRRYRIVVEADAFPSDLYAVDSHTAWHGLDPDEAVVRLRSRDGEATLRTEDIVDFFAREGDRVAVCLLGGVNYRTGQVLDMAAVTAAARTVGCVVGWDLAHAIGNVPLALHDWDVDFAVWCTYKYLNGGPGAVAGYFVHERHGNAGGSPRLAGWWGNDLGTRFAMRSAFDPAPVAAGWQVSNPPILAMAPLLSALELFDEVGMKALRQRSLRMSAYFDQVVGEFCRFGVRTLTPSEPAGRGCQVSLEIPGRAVEVYRGLLNRGVVVDHRGDSVLRAAPVPLYNTYDDIQRFSAALGDVLGQL